MEADVKVLQAEKKQSEAESDSAIERLHAHIEILRTDMERGLSANANKIMIAMGIGFAFLGVIIACVGLLFAGGS